MSRSSLVARLPDWVIRVDSIMSVTRLLNRWLLPKRCIAGAGEMFYRHQLPEWINFDGLRPPVTSPIYLQELHCKADAAGHVCHKLLRAGHSPSD
jgi:hypothetical protein